VRCITVLILFLFLNAFTIERPLEGKRHLQPSKPVAGGIPQPVLNLPPSPASVSKKRIQKRFSAVVTDVPVRQLLFALARDAKLNLDLAPGVEGKVTLNAIDQTLPQILERLTRQVDFRYRFERDVLIIEPDTPYFEHYPIPYVNLERDSSSTLGVTNQISSGDDGSSTGGGGNDNESATKIETFSKSHFWDRLVRNLQAVIGDLPQGMQGAQTGQGGQAGQGVQSKGPVSIIAHPESGILSIKATTKIHRRIRRYLDMVLSRAQRQVLIEATLVDVELGDRFRAGVDWEAVNVKLGSDKRKIDIVQNMLGQALSGPPALTIAYAGKDLAATVKLLSEFGTTRVISSPRLMVVNNQTAILRVVENRVYFTTTVDVNQTQGVSVTATETIPHTVSVGFVMSITPAIDDDDNVLLHVRPTISRITGFVKDPNPQLNTESLVPEIEVQEMESLLRLHDGNIGIIGGLMQDRDQRDTKGVAGLSNLPYVGKWFAFHDDQISKNELVIFIRPTVVRNVSLDGDLHDYRSLLERAESELP